MTPLRLAARVFSFKPPMGSTRPVNVTSPENTATDVYTCTTVFEASLPLLATMLLTHPILVRLHFHKSTSNSMHLGAVDNHALWSVFGSTHDHMTVTLSANLCHFMLAKPLHRQTDIHPKPAKPVALARMKFSLQGNMRSNIQCC